jgi:MFS family permease
MPKIINKVIKMLISSNVVFNFGWSLMLPFIAIFILQKISGDNVAESIKIVGFSELVFYATKSISQIPIGRYLDKNHGEKDDFWFMVIGTFITAFVPLGFLFSSYSWHIYIVQALSGFAAAMIFPSWSAVFTRHIDKGTEAIEWSTQSTSANIAVGIAGALGGIMAVTFGFYIIFIFASVFAFISGILLFTIKKEIFITNKKITRTSTSSIIDKLS